MLRALCSRDNGQRAAALADLHEQLPRHDAKRLSALLIDHLLHDPACQVRTAAVLAIRNSFQVLIDAGNAASLFKGLEQLMDCELESLLRHDAMRLLSLCGRHYGGLPVKLETVGDLECTMNEGLCILLGIYIGDADKFNRALACELLAALSVPSPMACALLSKEASMPVQVDSREMRLPWSYCGSYIIALEDEYEMVRLAAIRSLEALGGNRTFAERAFSFLVDSFQDESAVVRIASFTSLTRVVEVHALVVPFGHFESILSHLDDAEAEARAAVRGLVAASRIDEEQGLLRLFRCGAFVLEKFPDEAPLLYASLTAFGKLNARLIGESIARILKTEKFFIIPEPKIEDATYTVRLAAVLAALWVMPELDGALPAFTYRHYHYVHAKYGGGSVVSFLGHQLQGKFYSSLDLCAPRSPPSEAQGRILNRLQRCMQLKVTGQDYRGPLAVLRTNVEYDAAAFAEGYRRLLLDLIDAVEDGSIASVLRGYENVSDELAQSIQRIEESMSGGISPVPPLSMDRAIVKLEVTLETLPYTPERPSISRGPLPTMITIAGRLSCATSKQLAAKITIPGLEDLLFEAHVCGLDVRIPCKLSASALAQLPTDSPAHRIQLSVVTVEDRRPISSTASLFIRRLD